MHDGIENDSHSLSVYTNNGGAVFWVSAVVVREEWVLGVGYCIVLGRCIRRGIRIQREAPSGERVLGASSSGVVVVWS